MNLFNLLCTPCVSFYKDNVKNRHKKATSRMQKSMRHHKRTPSVPKIPLFNFERI